MVGGVGTGGTLTGSAQFLKPKKSDFKGKKLVILGVEVLKNKNTGADMNIMYLNSEIPNSVIWVDFDEAVKFNEIGFIPRKNKTK